MPTRIIFALAIVGTLYGSGARPAPIAAARGRIHLFNAQPSPRPVRRYAGAPGGPHRRRFGGGRARPCRSAW